MGAQGVVIDDRDRVLLIRHSYRPGWHFPGGGVEKNETVRSALARELLEEAEVTIEREPELFGLYANFHYFPSDHICLYIIRHWHQKNEPKPSYEIVDHKFFSKDNLPESTNPPTRRRLMEIFDNVPRTELW